VGETRGPFLSSGWPPSIDSFVIWMKWAGVVRFAEVVPGDDLDELRCKLKNLVPARVPQPVGVKDPIFVVSVGTG